jgi:MSHA biogenesis protein MshN
MPGSQLPLKLDIDLTAAPAVPVPALGTEAVSTAGEQTAASAQSEPLQVSPSNEARQESLPKEAALPEVPKSPAKKTAEKASAAVEAATKPATKTSAEPVIAVPPSLQVQEVPAHINKQFKELTAQQRAENEFRKAALFLQQGKGAEAAVGLEQALQLDSRHAGARQALIGIHLEAKRQDEAIRLAREGLDVNPAQPGVAMILARLQLEKGEPKHAIETLERSLEFASGRADYHAFLAAVLQRDERHKQAVEQYLLALQKTPQSGVWWMGLGISLQAERRVQEAREAFKRAKASNTLSPELQSFVDARLRQLQD